MEIKKRKIFYHACAVVYIKFTVTVCCNFCSLIASIWSQLEIFFHLFLKK